MTEETATNPVEGDELLPEAGVETEAEAPQLDDDGNPIEGQAEDDENEEIEHEGQKYKVPKALKPALMMQADYTRKTQELAEQRKALEAEKAQQAQASEEVISAKAELVAVDKQLAQYDKIDWRAWAEQDPYQAQAAFIEYQQMRDGRAKLAEDLTAKQQAQTLDAQRARAKQAEEGIAVLQKDIPGWGADLAAKLADFSVRELGFTQAEVDQIIDPRVVKLLHAAYVGKQTQAKTTQAQKIAQAQAVKPAATVGNSAPAAKSPERMSTEEWMRHRNKQLQRG